MVADHLVDDEAQEFLAKFGIKFRLLGEPTQPRDLASDVDAIRVIAHRNGLNPAVTVAHFLDSALSRGENGPLVHGWLSLLADAIGSDRQDIAACETFAAACSVRLAG